MTPNKQLDILNPPLVDREKIKFPPLYIKLGLMKQVVKSLNQEGECFKYICRTFQNVTIEKIKVAVLDGPQIKN